MNYTKLSQEHINSLQQIVGKDDVYTDHENLEKYGIILNSLKSISIRYNKL